MKNPPRQVVAEARTGGEFRDEGHLVPVVVRSRKGIAVGIEFDVGPADVAVEEKGIDRAPLDLGLEARRAHFLGIDHDEIGRERVLHVELVVVDLVPERAHHHVQVRVGVVVLHPDLVRPVALFPEGRGGRVVAEGRVAVWLDPEPGAREGAHVLVEVVDEAGGGREVDRVRARRLGWDRTEGSHRLHAAHRDVVDVDPAACFHRQAVAHLVGRPFRRLPRSPARS